MRTLYHATFKSRIKSILKEGIVPKKRSGYRGYFGQQLKESGKIYAFSNFDDAARWASKMEFDFQRPTVVVVFQDNKKWDKDTHFESAASKGKWLKRSGIVEPSNIIDVILITLEMKRALVKTLFRKSELIYKNGEVKEHAK